MSKKTFKVGFLYHKLRKTFAQFYDMHFDLVKQFYSTFINLIEEVYSVSHPQFYGDFLKQIVKK